MWTVALNVEGKRINTEILEDKKIYHCDLGVVTDFSNRKQKELNNGEKIKLTIISHFHSSKDFVN